MALKITRSSGNVFLDLGFPPAEAAHLKLRSDLVLALLDLIRDRGLTQARAAKLFGVSQPRVSDLKTMKIERFSIDTLIEMLGRAGAQVTITVKRGRRAA
jgi:predicted XRE-type DNA-binding protein